jgi:hypothetical protein
VVRACQAASPNGAPHVTDRRKAASSPGGISGGNSSITRVSSVAIRPELRTRSA